jgi:hypothetical protein
MKRTLLSWALAGAALLLAPAAAFAQTDSTARPAPAKPQLNTAPPAAPVPATPPPTQQREYEARPAVPVPPPPPVDEPLPTQNQPNPNSPSGLDFPAGSRASEQPKPLRKYFLYSNFGLGFSSIYGLTQFSISAAPAIGYRITERFAIGPGISYAYNSYAFRGGGNSIRTNSFGVKGFAQFIFYKDFFLHGEYEVTKAEVLFQDQQGALFPGKRTVTTPLAGAGYRTRFSDRAAADIVVLYNFNDGIDDIYGQPVIRFSFLFDLK